MTLLAKTQQVPAEFRSAIPTLPPERGLNGYPVRNNGLGVGASATILFLIIVLVVIWLASIVHILLREFKQPVNKIAWLIGVILIPILSPIYFLTNAKIRVNKIKS